MSNGNNLQPLPLCNVLSSPRFWETRDQRFPGSLSLAPGEGKERTLGTRLRTLHSMQFMVNAGLSLIKSSSWFGKTSNF